MVSYTKRILETAKILQTVKLADLNQKELKAIYEREKKKEPNSSCFKHPLIEPTGCPHCGNYRLDFGGTVYECFQKVYCAGFWDDKLCINICGVNYV